MADQLGLSFAELLRQLRIRAGLTQEELADSARLSPRSVSDLERGVNRTARKDTALLLADALGLASPVRDQFVAAARGRVPAADVLAAISDQLNNLPAAVDSFIGRKTELAEITAAVHADRLVTLAGPGGSGKTRLALEAASLLVPAFQDGVWLVTLATITDGTRLYETVAEALTVSDTPGEAIAVTLERWLRHRDLLLILDNCEHVLSAVTAFCEHLLPVCNRLRILATSREFLDARGEHAIQTPPLTVPDDPAQAPGSDAVQLFIARAVAAAPGFLPAEADLGIVAEVCRHLDGLPLAIELAAARLRALSLRQLSARLDDQFWRLAGGSRTNVSGQRPLEKVVAWSYDLLTATDQHAFRRLAIFPDHFTLDMAEAVVSDPPVEKPDVLDALASLVGKSLVATVTAPDGLRYRQLEMLRQYGRDRLVERDELDHFRERLFDWAMAGAMRLESVMRTPAMDDALRQATIEAVSYRAAMDWAAAHGEYAAALRIASTVPLSHDRGERRAEILNWLRQADEANQLDDAAAGHAWSAIGNLAFEQTDWQASRQASELAARHFQAAGLPRLAAWAQYLVVHSAWGAGQLAEVDSLVLEAIAGFRRERDDMGLGYSLWVASLRSADLAAADKMANEADGLLRRLNVPMGVAHNAEGRGIIAFERGELDLAATFVADAIETFSTYGNIGCAAHALEAAAVVVAAASPNGGGLATELLAAATELRRQSGQGHRPWEIRARLGGLEDRIGSPAGAVTGRGAPSAETPSGGPSDGARRYTLSMAASLATQALRSHVTSVAT